MTSSDAICKKCVYGASKDVKSSEFLTLRLGENVLAVPRADPIAYYEVWIAGVYSFLSLRESDVVVDIGATGGDFTILASKKIGPSGRVIAVEPSVYWVDLLRENVRLNGLRNVVIVGEALGKSGSRIRVRGISIESAGDGSKDAGAFMTAKGIHEVLARLGVDQVDVVKIDVEGAEADILQESETFRSVREVAVETHGSRNTSEVWRLLANLGFSVEALTLPAVLRHAVFQFATHPIDMLRAEFCTKGYGVRRLSRALLAQGSILVANPSQTDLRIVHGYRIS